MTARNFGRFWGENRKAARRERPSHFHNSLCYHNLPKWLGRELNPRHADFQSLEARYPQFSECPSRFPTVWNTLQSYSHKSPYRRGPPVTETVTPTRILFHGLR